MRVLASLDRDANRQVITSNEAFKLTSEWTFVGNLTGDQAAHTVFTVTGDVLVSVWGQCKTNIVGAGTIEVGITGNTAAIIAQIADATNLDAGENWVDATPETVSALPGTFILNNGADIILTIGTADLTAGVVDFYCVWRPLSSDGEVTVTTPA
tara:strand:+ start:3119 stop:3580 length:462 start_codon:yes stop_codon:yes gene_type:complete